MESEFRTVPPPSGWPALIPLIIPTFVAVPLAIMEWSLFHEDRGGASALSAVFGITLVLMLFLLVVGLWRWLRRPTREAVIQEATVTLNHFLQESPLISRGPTAASMGEKVSCVIPLLPLAISIGAFFTSRVLGFACVTVGLGSGIVVAWFMLHRSRQIQTITLDLAARKARFEYVTVPRDPQPQAPRRDMVLAFSEILTCTAYDGRNGRGTLRLTTTEGTVIVSRLQQKLPAIRSILNSVVVLNLADPVQYDERFKRASGMRFLLWGHLVTGAVIALIAILVWVFARSLH